MAAEKKTWQSQDRWTDGVEQKGSDGWAGRPVVTKINRFVKVYNEQVS